MKECPKCGVEISKDEIICHRCGSYTAYNRELIHPQLVQIASQWTEPTWKFCHEILGLDKKISNALSRGDGKTSFGLTPLEVISIGYIEALDRKGIGNASFIKLASARIDWKPKTK